MYVAALTGIGTLVPQALDANLLLRTTAMNATDRLVIGIRALSPVASFSTPAPTLLPTTATTTTTSGIRLLLRLLLLRLLLRLLLL